MSVADLILIACLQLNGDASCIKEISDCASSKQSAAVKEYATTCKDKKSSHEDCLNKQTPVEWSGLVLECVKARKK